MYREEDDNPTISQTPSALDPHHVIGKCVLVDPHHVIDKCVLVIHIMS